MLRSRAPSMKQRLGRPATRAVAMTGKGVTFPASLAALRRRARPSAWVVLDWAFHALGRAPRDGGLAREAREITNAQFWRQMTFLMSTCAP